MMEQNIHVCTGVIAAGKYHIIDVNGTVTLSGDVTFDLLRVQGSVRCHECCGGMVECLGGQLTCQAAMRVKHLLGHGTISVQRALTCQSVHFTGSICAHESITCSGAMHVNGMLRSDGSVRAPILHLRGTLYAHELHAVSVVLTPLASAMFAKYRIGAYELGSRVHRITSVSLQAHQLHGDMIESASVVLCERSRVMDVAYGDCLHLDATSSALMRRQLPRLATVGARRSTLRHGSTLRHVSSQHDVREHEALAHTTYVGYSATGACTACLQNSMGASFSHGMSSSYGTIATTPRQ